MNIYLGPKRSIWTNLSKNSCFHDERSFWPIFPGIIECDKPQGTLFRDPQAILTNTLELIRAFLGPKKLLKTQIFEKKGNLPSEENNLAIFFLYHWTRQKSGNNLKGSIWFSENCCAIDKIISSGPNRSIETNISKNSCFHDDERF